MKTNKPKAKVLFFGKLPPPYIGPALATQIILNSALSNSHQLIHFDTSHHSNIEQLGKWNIGNILSPLKLYYKLIVSLWHNKPDIVYIPSQQTTIGYLRDIPYFIIVKLFGRKLVCHLRGGYFGNWYNKEASVFMRWIIRRGQSMINRQIVLGELLRPMFEPLMPANKIFVVPNGANYDIPKPEVGHSEQLRVLYLANYIASKGILDFVEAAVICANSKAIHFHSYGNNMEQSTEIYMQQQNQMQPQLHVHGSISGRDKFAVLSDSDIFVFPTFYRNEGHPWVIIEAMAASLPIISTAHAAIPETVEDGVNGYLVPKNNPQAIADKILLLQQNPELRKQMGIASRRIYEQKFTEDHMAHKLKMVFDSLV